MELYNKLNNIPEVHQEPTHAFAQKVPPNIQQLIKEKEEEQTIMINELDLKDFKEKVKIWMGIDDEIKMLQDAIKERKEKKKQLTNEVLYFMNQHNIENLNTKKGDKLKYSVTKRKKTISNKEFKQKFDELFRNSENYEKYMEYMYGNREVIESINLRRVTRKININIDE